MGDSHSGCIVRLLTAGSREAFSGFSVQGIGFSNGTSNIEYRILNVEIEGIKSGGWGVNLFY